MSEPIPSNENRFLYPVALDIMGRSCVVVGGGIVGTRKAVALVEAGAAVTIVSPELCADATILVNDEQAIHIPEPFAPSHLNNAFLVVAATDMASVNSEVAEAARIKGVLVNMAAPGDGTASDSGDFATMATVRRGDLLLAVTTGGAGPALSGRIRRELSAQYGAEWEPAVALLAEFRSHVKDIYADPERRVTILHRAARKAEHLARLYKDDNGEAARQEVFACQHP